MKDDSQREEGTDTVIKAEIHACLRITNRLGSQLHHLLFSFRPFSHVCSSLFVLRLYYEVYVSRFVLICGEECFLVNEGDVLVRDEGFLLQGSAKTFG